MKVSSNIRKIYLQMRDEYPMCILFGISYRLQIVIMSSEDLAFAISRNCTIFAVKRIGDGCTTMDDVYKSLIRDKPEGKFDITYIMEGEWNFLEGHPAREGLAHNN